jgi:DNA-3-methyladenine glycosylase II
MSLWPMIRPGDQVPPSRDHDSHVLGGTGLLVAGLLVEHVSASWAVGAFAAAEAIAVVLTLVMSGPRDARGCLDGAMTAATDPAAASADGRALAHLRNADPVLARVIDAHADFDPRGWLRGLPPMDAFGALIFMVTGQQLSVRSAARILGRIQDQFGGRLPTPDELLATDPGELLAAGLSRRKVATLRAVAGQFADGSVSEDELRQLADEEIIDRLTTISGIGPWTVHGLLIIALDRADVVLPGDLALRKAIRRSYQLDHLPSQQEVLRIAEPWRPYRSLATAYLFQVAVEDPGAPPPGQASVIPGLAAHRAAAFLLAQPVDADRDGDDERWVLAGLDLDAVGVADAEPLAGDPADDPVACRKLPVHVPEVADRLQHGPVCQRNLVAVPERREVRAAHGGDHRAVPLDVHGAAQPEELLPDRRHHDARAVLQLERLPEL